MKETLNTPLHREEGRGEQTRGREGEDLLKWSIRESIWTLSEKAEKKEETKGTWENGEVPQPERRGLLFLAESQKP